jgi:hypothetical protein
MKLLKSYIWGTALHGAEDTLACKSEIHGKLKMWCWRRMEKISWTDHVRNDEVLHRVKEERNNLPIMKRRKVNWIGHSLRRQQSRYRPGVAQRVPGS